ncbi:MAG: DUF2201 family putative metallopeptidase, partial [Myxococcota bacterium]
MTKDEARILWEKDRTRMLLDQPFMGVLALQLDIVPVEDDRVKRAATDGRHLFINPTWLGTLMQEERVFVMAHEVWHCGLRHFSRAMMRDDELWGLAIDHEVNWLLVDDGFPRPTRIRPVMYEDLHEQSAEEVYDVLKGVTDAKLALMKAMGVSFDTHQYDDVAAGDTGLVDDDYLPIRSGDAMAGWPEKILAVAQQLERQNGHLPAGFGRVVKRLRSPRVPWQELLRQFVTSAYGSRRTWSPPHRRHAHKGLFLPGHNGEKLKVAVAVDTSGSTQMYL